MKEVEDKTKELKKLMKKLYNQEKKYGEYLYKYGEYENKQILEINIESKAVLKEFIKELKNIGAYTCSEEYIYKIKLKNKFVRYNDYVYDNGIGHMDYIKKLTKIKLFIIKGLYFNAVNELINFEHEYDILLKSKYENIIKLI